MAGEGKRENNHILWKNFKNFAKKLIELKIIEILFGEKAHEELINKCQGIIFLLIDNNSFTDEHVISIWECCCGNQETVAKSALDILKLLLSELSISVN